MRYLCLLMVLLSGCYSSEPDSRSSAEVESANPSGSDVRSSVSTSREAMLVERLVLAEDLALDLTFQLREFADWISTGSPEVSAPAFHQLKSCFGTKELSTDTFHDLVKQTTLNVGFESSSFDWPLADLPTETKARPLAALGELLGDIRSIKFGVLSADFVGEDKSKFEMLTKLSAKASKNGIVSGIAGKQLTTWALREGVWYLTGWKSQKLNVTTSRIKLFKDVTEQCIPDKETLAKVRRSRHEEFVTNTINTGNIFPDFGDHTAYVDAASPHALPSITVVDYDNDLHDDLFISGRWCPTQMLKNMGNGTFKDVTDEVGLSFPAVVNCSAFVDLDNDGDKDAIIGRSLEPVVYLRNDGGKFVNVTFKLSNLESQYMVSAISVSDINRDGLLDLYLSTYGPFGQNSPINITRENDWKRRFLRKEDAEKLVYKHNSGHGFVDNAGPPNLLVMNRGGGRLEMVRGNELTEQWHHSYQSSWGDVDNDGDDDLYIANDFAGDGFLINETPAGSARPVFVNGILTHFDSAASGFGMGASWGDFDSDGDFDLYVSNMYSKAGKRVLNFLGKGDERIDVSTQGNFLFQNSGGRLKNVAGVSSDQQDVGRVGWSYGGQFLDIDNNGRLDLYVPSGYFTAVSASDSKVDI